MYESALAYAAELARPWVWPAAYIAVGSFVLFGITRLWAFGPGLRLAKRTMATAADGGRPTLGHRIGGGLLRSFVGLTVFSATVLGKVSAAAAIIACAGFLAIMLTAPAAANAGDPMLKQAQQFLQAAIPTEFSKVSNLAAPEVTTGNGSTTYTFRIPKKAGAKSAKAQTYSVTIGRDGVEVKQGP